MRLVTHRTDSGPRAGVLLDCDRVVDAWDALGGGCGTMRGLLKADRFAELAKAAAGAEGEPLEEDGLLPPVPDPEKIICIGLNYGAHAEETKQELPTVPTIFGKFRNALAAPGATVELPAASEKVDYEAEVCVVIGRRLKDVGPDEALAGVAGYTLMNDLSARDLQLATTQWMAGKTFDGAAPCGPALVTADEVAHDAIEFELTLNGERMQASSTSDLIFAVPDLVAHLSTLMTLEPGDLISTGTPSGVGIARRPSVWLKPGDVIEISSPQLGLLRTRVG
jgi:2-keto-4-pentenoate hydratase/2-oxohepta-3-ene-1,7-dioic acid hydratase in catechol pathway